MSEKLYFNQLDAIRGIACLYVLFHNFVYGLHAYNLVHPLIKLSFAAGQEAVIVFFILSGFVVQISALRNPDRSFKTFFIHRFRRIYFPLIISMLISIFVLYLKGDLLEKLSLTDVVGNLLLLQDFGSVKPGTWFYPFLGNLPLWSLSYEWWFYMMFYPATKCLKTSSSRIYYILTFCTISYIIYIVWPNQICLICSYFIIWWAGVEAANVFVARRELNFQTIKPILFSLLFMLLVTLIPLLNVSNFKPGHYPFLIFRHFCAAFLVLLVGVYLSRRKLGIFGKILSQFSIISPISYGVYVFSYPILVQWGLSSFVPRTWPFYLMNLAILFGMAYAIEIKLQPWVNRWIK